MNTNYLITRNNNYMSERVKHYVRELYENRIIIDNAMSLFPFETFYKAIQARDNFDCPFNLFVYWLVHLKLVSEESSKTEQFQFNAAILSAIIDNNASIKLHTSTTLVDQRIAFRRKKNEICLTCKHKFADKNALESHQNAKKHFFSGSDDGLIVQHTAGVGNLPEIIYFTRLNEKTSAKISFINPTNGPLIVNEIIQENTGVSEFVQINLTGFVIPPSNKVALDLRVNFVEYRTFYYPLIITYKNADDVVHQLVKTFVLENVAREYDHLHAEAPFKPIKVVIKDEDDVIIYGKQPEAKTRQISKKLVKLQNYALPKSITQLLNCGLKDSDKLSQASKDLLLTLKRLLSVENPLNALTPNNYCELLKYLLYIEEHQMNKDIRNFDMETTDLEYISNEDLYKLRVPGLAEHRPSIIVRDSVFIKIPETNFKYEGIVHRVEKEFVLLGFNDRFTEVFIKNSKVLISFTFNRYSIRTEHQAIQIFKSLDLSNIFFPLLPENRPLKSITYNWIDRMKVGENREQQQAIEHIISKTSLPAPYLIFGPPGTGKTTTIVECIQQIRRLLPNDKILICTPSNNAANVITKRLLNIPKSELLRYVAESASYYDLREADLLNYCNYDRDQFYYPTKEDLVKYRIIVTTLVNAARLYNNGIPANHFSYVFVDEAGHATETETLIPIAGIGYCDKDSPNNTQVVLIGDPKQLGPIIHSTLALHYGFAISMLERFMNTQEIYQRSNGEYNKNVLTKLLKNYRSHEYIIEVPRQKFYDNELRACNKEFAYLALGHEILPNSKFPLIFHSVFGRDEQEASSPSFFNVLEISVIFDYLKKLIGTKMKGRKIEQKDIAIISPYSKQVKKIRNHCFKVKYDDLAIGTVEQFQGQEKLIVIISTVRSSPEYAESHDFKYHLGFLKNPKRMNVALTRAQALVIVIGNPSLLQYDENWYTFMKYCKNNSSFVGSHFDLPSTPPNLPSVANGVTSRFESLSANDQFARGNI